MADQRITDLPAAQSLTDAGLLVIYQSGQTQSLTGAKAKSYVVEAVSPYVEQAAAAAEDAADAQTAAESAQTAAETAQTAAETAQSDAEAAQAAAETAVLRYPYISSTTGDWMVWDAVSGAYVDTEISATGPEGPQGTTGDPGADGISPAITASKVGRATTLTIYDAAHPSGAVLAVIMDGQDGSGAGDMLKAVYDINDDGIVDNSAALDGHAASYFAPATHVADISNPHEVTKEQVGLGSVANVLQYSASNPPPADSSKLDASQKGAANGVATLDANSKVTAEQAAARIVNISGNTTLGSSHYGCLLLVTGSPTLTIPTGLTVGAEIEILNYGTGTVTVAGASGVTLNGTSAGSKSIAGQYTGAVLKCVASNAWVIQGAIS